MASEVTISNMALSHVGATAKITSISPPDGSVLSGHCADFYSHSRKEMLELGSWKFALKRAALAEIATNPSEYWAYAYALPSKCLSPRRILQAGSKPDADSADFTVEGEVLFANQEEAELLYIEDVTDTTKFPAEFVTALSYLLASYIVGPIVKGVTAIKLSRDLRALATLAAQQAAVTEANATHQTEDWTATSSVSVRQ